MEAASIAVEHDVFHRRLEQTGRELTVNGSSSLLLMPSPHIVLTDVEIESIALYMQSDALK